MKIDTQSFQFSDPGRVRNRALIVGIIALAITAIGLFTDPNQFWYSYLFGFVYWTTLGLGAFVFILIHHLTDSTWSIVIRRIVESAMRVLPYLGILLIPLFIFGMHDIFHWAEPDAVAHDPLLQKKQGYLNIPFFVIRSVGYFVIWYLLIRLLTKHSLAQDKDGNPEHNVIMRRISAPGIVLFALTITLAGFDWLMSLDPHWYSTIFGVYTFSGSYVSALAMMIVIVVLLQRSGVLTEKITVEHYHDLGKLLFTFTVFWAYIAGSQYFFIWYANIPEETVWFLNRWKGSWKTVSLILIFGQFAIPFIVLIFRNSKRNLKVLTFMAVWVMVAHMIDLYWLIMPNLHPENAQLSWMDLTALVGIGGLSVALFWHFFTRNSAIPIQDPKLQQSINFTNA